PRRASGAGQRLAELARRRRQPLGGGRRRLPRRRQTRQRRARGALLAAAEPPLSHGWYGTSSPLARSRRKTPSLGRARRTVVVLAPRRSSNCRRPGLISTA